MQLIYKDLADLKPYDKNPRKNDQAVEKVARSIKDYGFQQPIVCDKDGVIIVGHTRYKAAKKLGLKAVPVVFADLSEEKANEYRLVDNKTNEFAEWDFDLLTLEVDDLPELDLDFYGFDIDRTEDTFEEEQQELFEDVEKEETHYGVPYQGNKSRIADIICHILPKGGRLVDLFGGGGAITHCGMLKGKWHRYLYNDINPMITTLFMDAVNGKYHDERRVITRKDFEELKDTDPYVKYIWSFGNNGRGYLWGKDIEDIKCQACKSLMEMELKDRRLAYVAFVKMLNGNKVENINRLQSIEHLQALTQLEALQRLEVTNNDYKDYEYQDGDIVYCDVPYEQISKGKCDDYGVTFDSKEFYEWAKSRPYQVFFSSYEISDNSFYNIKIKNLMSLIGANTNSQKRTEYLYSNREIIIS